MVLHAHVKSIAKKEDCQESYYECLEGVEEGNNEGTHLRDTP